MTQASCEEGRSLILPTVLRSTGLLCLWSHLAPCLELHGVQGTWGYTAWPQPCRAHSLAKMEKIQMVTSVRGMRDDSKGRDTRSRLRHHTGSPRRPVLHQPCCCCCPQIGERLTGVHCQGPWPSQTSCVKGARAMSQKVSARFKSSIS